VQATVEHALATVLRLDSPPTLTVAGRTDAGVHARNQVAHVDLATDPPTTLERSLNGVLPPDVRLLRFRRAPRGFDARFSAMSRRYAYRVGDRGVDPLRRRDTVAHPRPLDAALMTEAAAALVGEHDFAAFCRQRPGASTIRRLLRLTARRSAGVVLVQAEADAFCQSMVRSLVGALLAVGDGRRPAGWPGQVLAGRHRDPAVTVAPAAGLTLLSVCYPPAGRLAERAAETRRRRDLE
jgi:tRNA pseudouridine38-40 synthase